MIKKQVNVGLDDLITKQNKETEEKEKKRILGLDNLCCESGTKYQQKAKQKLIKLAYSSGNYTNTGCAVTDEEPGNDIKYGMTKKYKSDLQSSSERLKQWKNNQVSVSERRILMTKWLGETWEEYSKNNQKTITNAFKKVGMYNAFDRSEIFLIKIRKCTNYTEPRKKKSQIIIKNKNHSC